ncbi:unnamed protein product [Darwinula stevensoni]|uniref:TauD/TfdA-like domain-containing protein n=1 Tax=Darwinula stevensoni TaxID=69355 RepID=A0A7R9AC35_9CRUS|nr:unnamed protein product [Darwinula stevensoni]CAG0899952.1 unnamed protein product [Darwinula stevensoni]
MLSFLLKLCKHSMRAAMYELKPIQLGCEVFGFDLLTDPSAEMMEQIKDDLARHRILVFRNQGQVPGKRHVEISWWFGEPESTFYKHPKSPDPDVFRVSNDPKEGCTGVGRTGWHIDGTFQQAPFSYSLYHMWSVPKEGDTIFLPLNELIEGLSSERKGRWERLYMISDRRGGPVHPLIYSHPITKKKTMCFHLGMTEAFMWDKGTSKQRITCPQETAEILQEIEDEIEKRQKHLQYSHKWEVGDFMISDNLAVGHFASPQTQHPVGEVGLRVLHRTTIKGFYPPQKEY